ncbi:GNAT family N-acetyltransferase [Ochrobactrum sp. MR28]|nr:GNAT family N-acetyltransferase [Ochrobactrum sp. MR28]MBX8815990.1 GNAT family N-acetyltransferase [Ochrobactrum sp. MR31]
MQLRKFCREDWQWIQLWFQDEYLNAELGPLDEEWLNHVLNEVGGVQLVVECGDRPVGLIGCVWGNGTDLPHAITDIAVAPDLRRTGLGQRIVAEVMNWEGHPLARNWVAYVAQDNDRACRFFIHIGWKYCGIEDEMHCYQLAIPVRS